MNLHCASDRPPPDSQPPPPPAIDCTVPNANDFHIANLMLGFEETICFDEICQRL